MATAHAGAASGAARPGARERSRAAVWGCAHASSLAGDVERAVVTGRAGPPGCGDAARQPLRGQRFAVPGVGGAQDVLTPQRTCVESIGSLVRRDGREPSGRNVQLK